MKSGVDDYYSSYVSLVCSCALHAMLLKSYYNDSTVWKSDFFPNFQGEGQEFSRGGPCLCLRTPMVN